MFSKRLIKAELLDHASQEEARENLADLVRINRNFGGHSVIRKALARTDIRSDAFSLLDVGAASGDTATLIQELYPGARITSLDYSRVNIEAAPPPKVIADAFHLPFAPTSFDYVLCSLFLHHFPNEKVIVLLRNFYALARRALIVCDLERHFLPYYFLPATKPLFGWRRITLHDGPVSVRAAFRPHELLELAREAGLDSAEIESHRPAFRISLIARRNGRKESGGHSEEDTHRRRTAAFAGGAPTH